MTLTHLTFDRDVRLLGKCVKADPVRMCEFVVPSMEDEHKNNKKKSAEWADDWNDGNKPTNSASFSQQYNIKKNHQTIHMIRIHTHKQRVELSWFTKTACKFHKIQIKYRELPCTDTESESNGMVHTHACSRYTPTQRQRAHYNRCK